MRVLNFGSLNRDLVYSVAHAVRPGETLASSKLETFCGGKGLNQSLALARAGAQVWHAGCVGADGGELRKMLADMNSLEAMEFIKQRLESTHNNEEFLISMNG